MRPADSTEAYHDFGQSVSVFELLGERHQAGLSYLELGRLAAAAGARSRAIAVSVRRGGHLRGARRRARTSPRRALALEGIPQRRPAATSACRWTGKTPSSGGSWMPRSCRPCSRAKGRRRSSRRATPRRRWSSSSCPAPRCGWRLLPDATSSRRGRSPSAVTRSVETSDRALAVAIEPLGRDVEGPRFAVVSTTRPFPGSGRGSGSARCARCCDRVSTCAPRASGRSKPSAACSKDRSSRCFPGSCARARRCSAWSTDSADAGQRSDRAHHRRERHRQRPRRAGDSCRIAAPRQHVPSLQLHERDPRACGQSAVRPSPRQLHWRDRRPAGRAADRRRRNAVPR